MTPLTASEPTEVGAIALRGVRECDRRNYVDALSFLDTAAEALGGIGQLPPRALSAYALALAACDQDRRPEAMSHCKLALRRKPIDPFIYRNLASIYLLDGSRQYAVHTLEAGLKVDPKHAGLRNTRQQLGVRKPPVFHSLPREHRLNLWAGKLRHKLLKLLSR